MEKGLDKLYSELKFVQERRSKLAILKLGFVAGFFGIGSLKLGTNVDAVSRTALYLVPLVAVLFDLFGIASTITIKKLEAFLRKKESETTVLNDWKSFSQEHCLHRLPEWCNQASHFILTATAFIVPAAVLWKDQAECLLSFLRCDLIWIVFIVWPVLLWTVGCILKRLAEKNLSEEVLSPWFHCGYNLAFLFSLAATPFLVMALFSKKLPNLQSLLGSGPTCVLFATFLLISFLGCIAGYVHKCPGEKFMSKEHLLPGSPYWYNLAFLVGLTATPFLVLAALLWSEQTSLLSFLQTDLRWVPFVGPLILWSAFRILECLAKRKLERNDPKSGSQKNNQNDTIPPQEFTSNDCDPQGPQRAPA